MMDLTSAARELIDDCALEQTLVLASSLENEIGKPDTGIAILFSQCSVLSSLAYLISLSSHV